MKTFNNYSSVCRATGAGTFSTRNNSQDSTANGAAAVSLRGMGPDATLVLINGRRVAISAFAESITNSFVDINSIPVSAIERIDILKDGASGDLRLRRCCRCSKRSTEERLRRFRD